MAKRKAGTGSASSPRASKKVSSERCAFAGCKCSATFGMPATRERKWCSKHKAAGAINLRTKLCESCDNGVLCTKQATFGYATDRRKRWCASHRPKGTIDVKNRRCDVEGCEKQAIHRQASGARTCGKHKHVAGLVGRDTTPKGKAKKSTKAATPPLSLASKAQTSVSEGLSFLKSLEKAANHVDKQALAGSAKNDLNESSPSHVGAEEEDHEQELKQEAVKGAHQNQPTQHQIHHPNQPEYPSQEGWQNTHNQHRVHMNEVTMATPPSGWKPNGVWHAAQHMPVFQDSVQQVTTGGDMAQENSRLRLQLFQQQLQFNQKIEELQNLYQAREKNIFRENQLLKQKMSENVKGNIPKHSSSDTNVAQGNLTAQSITDPWIKQKLEVLSREIRAEHEVALSSSWLPEAAYQLPVVALAAQRLLADITSIYFPQHSYAMPPYNRFGEVTRSQSSSFSQAAAAESKKKA